MWVSVIDVNQAQTNKIPEVYIYFLFKVEPIVIKITHTISCQVYYWYLLQY